ncbi:DUF3152 domain-containing protein [Kitasatospora sp. NPDC096147]|uniref:DUF3152 domain-containing protein n=1 Tax=Kitasatospora sp. NPDC096147 TaxID=3364093 RepID=UPI0037FDF43C
MRSNPRSNPAPRARRAGAPAPTRRRAAAARRRQQAVRRRRLVLLVGLTGALAVLGVTAFNLTGSDGEPTAPATTQARAVPAAEGTPPAQPPAPEPAPTPSPTPVEVVEKGKGTFSTVQANGPVVGKGSTLRKYKVEVEDGIGIDAATATDQVQKILADKRGWTADGKHSFQLVASGPANFSVKIASPDTVDAVCGKAGLNTGGEVNCNVGDAVMVNTKRWTIGSPQFSGPIEEYRALIVNHEVGHFIGHGHEGCGGAGKPAPAMMQQIYGLEGCVSNAWPYTEAGKYISGPARK